MSNPRFDAFNTLTFDVVGTLIDFESGIIEWFMPLLRKKEAVKSEEEILIQFAICEDKYQHKTPDQPFTAMLPMIYEDMMLHWKLSPSEEEASEFRESIQHWPAFPDTITALKKLKVKYRLVAMTNADAWALQYMSETLENPFDE